MTGPRPATVARVARMRDSEYLEPKQRDGCYRCWASTAHDRHPSSLLCVLHLARVSKHAICNEFDPLGPKEGSK